MGTRTFFGAVAAVSIALATSTSGIQAQNVGFRYQITPKSGNGPAFETALREHIAFRTANGDTWTWAVYQVAAGAELGDFLVLSPNHRYSDMDAYQSAAFQGSVSAHFGATVMPLVESIGLRFNIVDTVITNPMPTESEVNLAAVTRYYVTPGGSVAFDEALARFHEAVIENDYPAYFSVNRPSLGGPGGTVNIVGLTENWAGLDPRNPTIIQLMISHYGQERATEIFESFLSSYSHSEEYLLRVRRDLSTN